MRTFCPEKKEKKPWNARGASAQEFESAAVHPDSRPPVMRSSARAAMGIKKRRLQAAQIMAYFLSPGSYADVNALYNFSFPIHSANVIYGDRTYNAYNLKMKLNRSNIDLNPVRNKNSKREYEIFAEDGIKLIRKRIESAFSVIAQRFPAHIKSNDADQNLG